MLVQGKIPVFGVPFNRRLAAEGTMRVDQHIGAEGAAAILTLISIGPLVAADRTGAHNISVRQKGPGFLIVILFTLLYFQFAPAVEVRKKFLGGLMMNGLAGPVID